MSEEEEEEEEDAFGELPTFQASGRPQSAGSGGQGTEGFAGVIENPSRPKVRHSLPGTLDATKMLAQSEEPRRASAPLLDSTALDTEKLNIAIEEEEEEDEEDVNEDQREEQAGTDLVAAAGDGAEEGAGQDTGADAVLQRPAMLGEDPADAAFERQEDEAASAGATAAKEPSADLWAAERRQLDVDEAADSDEGVADAANEDSATPAEEDTLGGLRKLAAAEGRRSMRLSLPAVSAASAGRRKSWASPGEEQPQGTPLDESQDFVRRASDFIREPLMRLEEEEQALQDKNKIPVPVPDIEPQVPEIESEEESDQSDEDNEDADTQTVSNKIKRTMASLEARMDKKYVKKQDFMAALARITRLEKIFTEKLGDGVKGQVAGLMRKEFDRLERDLKRKDEKIEAQKVEMNDLRQETLLNKNRLRDEKHRTENAVDHTMRTVRHMEKVNEVVDETKQALRYDVDRLANSLQSLAQEVKTINEEHKNIFAKGRMRRKRIESEGELKSSEPLSPSPTAAVPAQASESPAAAAPVVPSISGSGDYPSMTKQHTMSLAPQVASMFDYQDDEQIIKMKKILSEHQLLHETAMRDLRYLKDEVKNCAKEDVVEHMGQQVDELANESARLQQMVQNKLFETQTQEKREMVKEFAAKWDPYKRQNLMNWCFFSWVTFKNHQNQIRDAMSRAKNVYARTHVTARLRTWWYIMQRDKGDANISRLNDQLESQEVKLEGLRTTVIRHEKTTSEHARGFQSRMMEAEKGIEVNERDKASKLDVQAEFEKIRKRLDEDFSLGPIRADIKGLETAVQELQATKFTVKQADEDRHKVTSLDREFRAWLKHHDEMLKTKASISDNNDKADAKSVEEVLVLLAKQADQLASMVSDDINQVRTALARFLEISPDHRKAALAIGLEQPAECVSCRALNRKLLPADSVTGADGQLYKISAEQPAVEQAQRVLQEKLKFPATLTSSLAAGSTVVGRHRGGGDEGETMPQLRKMLNAKEGWLSEKAKDRELREMSREMMQLDEAPSTPNTPGTPRKSLKKALTKEGIASAAPFMTRRPPSAQDTSGATATPTAGARPPSARSYFPAVESRGSVTKKSR